jgi:class 3 adenylate cyclase
LQGSIAGTVFETGEAVRNDAVSRNASHFKGVDDDTTMHTEAMLCVPLTAGSERLGVVQLLNKRIGSYTDRELILLEHFAAQAAVAIRNAQLFDDLLAHMGLYVSPEYNSNPLDLLAELQKPPRSELLSVLFADMRGFTQLCHIVSRPEDTQRMLNEFLTLLADATIEYGGAVNKFLGDGMLALFRGDDHAKRALKAADLMTIRFDQLHRTWNANVNVPLTFLDIGIGIATDWVVLGSVGSRRVRDFTAIGTTVNLASSLMEDARGGRRILVDKFTYMANQDRIELFEGPEGFELKKPGQSVGHPYERYWVKSIAARPILRHPSKITEVGMRNDVFVSYSHHDAHWLHQLQTHLTPFTRTGSISAWDDTKIKAGKRWRDEIEQALVSAKVAVLLVTPHFLSSEFIAANELPPLLAAAETSGLQILWVPISASSFNETPIGDYQSVLKPEEPLDGMTDSQKNVAWVSVCKQIKAALTSQKSA